LEDALWKELVTEFFPEFLHFFFPAIGKEIDFSAGWETLDKELQKIAPESEVGKKVADMLFKVYLKSGEEQWIMLHIEVQGYPEPNFSERMFVYNYRIYDRYRRAVVSLGVLTDRRKGYRPREFGWRLDGFEHVMRFPVAKLLDWEGKEEELEESENPFGIVVLGWLKGREREEGVRFEERLKLSRRIMRMFLERGYKKEQIRRLFWWIEKVLRLSEELEEKLEERLREEVGEMSIEVFGYMEEKAYKRGLEQGLQQGIQQGLQRGIQQGLQQGKKEGLKLALELRFGRRGVELFPKVEKLKELAQIEALIELLKTSDSYEEFVALLEKFLEEEG